MKPIIELRKVSKIYSTDGVPVNALKDVNLEVNKKELIAVMGPSGSGKSTLLHIMGCLDRPTHGKVYIEGKDVSHLSDNDLAKIRRQKIGFVFQFFNLISNFTAFKNVELPMVFSNMPNREKRAKELLRIVGLEKRMSHYPSQLSGGETQRVAIARALANKPEVILADEPTGNLDTKSGKEILNLLVKLNKTQNLTLILVTHESYIASYAKKRIYIKDGQIIKEKRR
jgi:putative ABC transport system ATP-binding protein